MICLLQVEKDIINRHDDDCAICAIKVLHQKCLDDNDDMITSHLWLEYST